MYGDEYGAFAYGYSDTGNYHAAGDPGGGSESANMDASRVVPTGVDNAPSTFNVNYWRLINLQ